MEAKSSAAAPILSAVGLTASALALISSALAPTADAL